MVASDYKSILFFLYFKEHAKTIFTPTSSATYKNRKGF